MRGEKERGGGLEIVKEIIGEEKKGGGEWMKECGRKGMEGVSWKKRKRK